MGINSLIGMTLNFKEKIFQPILDLAEFEKFGVAFSIPLGYCRIRNILYIKY
jgi:hypothetical protein